MTANTLLKLLLILLHFTYFLIYSSLFYSVFLSGNKFPNLEYLSITRNPSVPDLTDFYFTEKESESIDTNILEDEKVGVEVEVESNDKTKKTDFNLGIKSIFSNFMTQNSPNTTKKSSSEDNIKTNVLKSESVTVINSEIATNLMEINTKNENENSILGNKTKILNFEKGVNKSFSSFSFLTSFTSNNKVDANDNGNISNNNNKNDLNNRFGSWTDLGQEHVQDSTYSLNVHDSTYSLNSVTTNQFTIDNDNCDQKIQNSNNNNDDNKNNKTNHIISNNNDDIVNDIITHNSININEDELNTVIDTSNNYTTNINNINKDEINVIHNTLENIDANYISFDDISDFKSKIKINSQNVSWKEENENEEILSIDIKMKNNKSENNNNNNNNFNNNNSNIDNNITEKEKDKEMEKKTNNVILNIDRKSYRKAVLRMLPNLKILDDGKITNKVSFYFFSFYFYFRFEYDCLCGKITDFNICNIHLILFLYCLLFYIYFTF